MLVGQLHQIQVLRTAWDRQKEGQGHRDREPSTKFADHGISSDNERRTV
jgi:hypothetical protein